MAQSEAKARSIHVETGNDKIDMVVLRDLAFWLLETKDHLREGVLFVESFGELVELPVAQIRLILAVVVLIIKKNRVIWRRADDKVYVEG